MGPLKRLVVAWLEASHGWYVMSGTQETDLYAAVDGTRSAGDTSAGGVHVDTSQTTVPQSLQAPRAARRFVEASICGEHACRSLGAVRLAASEFATQATLLGDGPLTIGLNCDLTTVTVWAVFPTSVPVFGTPLSLADDVAAWVIEGISREWGTECLRDAERLWCTIPSGYPNLPVKDPAAVEATEVVDELAEAPSEALRETRRIDIDRLFGSLPELERKARMYELVMLLGLVDPA